MVQRAREREPQSYFVGLLDRYEREQQLTQEQLAAFLGVAPGLPWIRLALCGYPRMQPAHFWGDMREIALGCGADPDRLVVLVRALQTLDVLRELGREFETAGDPGLLAAARDRAVETEDTPEPSAERPDGTEARVRPLQLWLEAGLQTAIRRFWDAAGVAEPEPGRLEQAALRSLPCMVVYLPHLALSRMEAWLNERHITYRFPCRNRFVRGGLLAYRGCGLIFIDAEDSPEEQRYTLAHEVIHLLLDYLLRRDEAMERLGPAVADVLDGRRPPTLQEQVEASLEDISLVSYYHLLDRYGATLGGPATRSAGAGMDRRVSAAEDIADRLALELLAPSAVVIERLATLGVSAQGGDRQRIIALARTLLQDEYQLPRQPALIYATTLAEAMRPPTVESWLADL
jgi:hypothetical protein